jgi:cytochrome c556
MKTFTLSVALAAAMAQAPSSAQTARPAAPPAPAHPAVAATPARNVGSMSDLMVKIIYPTSDALFYVESRTPKDEAEWNAFEGQMLMLAESANLLMMPGRARDQKQWMADAKLMLDAGALAVKAAKTKNVESISALSDQLLESCTTCHKHYRPGYGQKPQH